MSIEADRQRAALHRIAADDPELAARLVLMMLPAAAPMILFFATFSRRSCEQGHTVAPVGAFVSGYVAVWSAFSLAATT